MRHSRAHSWWFGMGYYLLAVVTGCGGIFSDPHPGPQLLSGVGIPLVLGGWMTADAASRKSPIPLFSHAWVVSFSYWLVPFYFLQSRGWRGAGWLLLHVAASTALAYAIAYGGQELANVIAPE